MSYHRSNFNVLLVTSLHPKATDEEVRETLYRQFRKFGDLSVRVLLEPEGRVAFVYFCNSEEASNALNSKVNIVFNDKPVTIKPIIEDSSNGSHRSTISPPFSPYQSTYRNRSPSRSSSIPYKDHHYQYPYHPYSSRGSRGHPDFYSRGRGRGCYDPHRGSYRGRPGWQRPYDSNRNEAPRKYYPYHTYHIPPEEDAMATRNLFVGNLELDMTEEELKKIFGRFGRLLQVVLKRPPVNSGTFSAFAFIHFETVDMAFLAKKELSGQFFGRLQCKIGYGNSNPTPRIWVGGLGSWCSANLLWREFDRFGVIRSLDFNPNDTFATILFESQVAAESAVQSMRGYPLGGPENRIRVDFSDVGEPEMYNDKKEDKFGGVLTISDLCKKVAKAWDGGLILKKSFFGTQLHLLDGSAKILDCLIDDDGENNIVIKQRLKMDQSKLDDVSARLGVAESGRSIFLGIPVVAQNKSEKAKLTVQPLRNLISYLKMKEAAGVIAINYSDDQHVEHQRVLYCFPPCDFVTDLVKSFFDISLHQIAPDLCINVREDFVVVIVV